MHNLVIYIFIFSLLSLVGCGNSTIKHSTNMQEDNQTSSPSTTNQLTPKGHYVITIIYNYPSDICKKDKLFPLSVADNSLSYLYDDITVSIENNDISCQDFNSNDICTEDKTYINMGYSNLACVINTYMDDES